MPLLKRHSLDDLCFIDDFVCSTEVVNGVKVLSFEAFQAIEAEQKAAVVAIADNRIRSAKYDLLEASGVRHHSVRRPIQ